MWAFGPQGRQIYLQDETEKEILATSGRLISLPDLHSSGAWRRLYVSVGPDHVKVTYAGRVVIDHHFPIRQDHHHVALVGSSAAMRWPKSSLETHHQHPRNRRRHGGRRSRSILKRPGAVAQSL